MVFMQYMVYGFVCSSVFVKGGMVIDGQFCVFASFVCSLSSVSSACYPGERIVSD